MNRYIFYFVSECRKLEFKFILLKNYYVLSYKNVWNYTPLSEERQLFSSVTVKDLTTHHNKKEQR